MSEKEEDRITDSEKKWQLAQLTAQLVSDRLSRHDAAIAAGEDGPITGEIETAIRHAELILDFIENPRKRPISLYRLFDEGEQISTRKLAERIMDLKWSKRKKSNLENTLKTLRNCWRERLDHRQELVSSGNFLAKVAMARLEKTLAEIESDYDVSKEIPEFQSWCAKLPGSFASLWPMGAYDEESQKIAHEREECLYRWCIEENLRSEGGVSVRICRPHELFRFTEQFDWFPEEFGKQEVKDLPDDVTVGPPRPTHIHCFDKFKREFWSDPERVTKYLESLSASS